MKINENVARSKVAHVASPSAVLCKGVKPKSKITNEQWKDLKDVQRIKV